MKLNTVDSISPNTLRLIILAMGLGLAFFVHSGVAKKVSELKYTPLYGDFSAEGGSASFNDSTALPIVVAKTKSTALRDGLSLSDELIAGAFNPVVEIMEDAEPEQTEERASDLLTQSYNPTVSAITNRGAVINGTHWNVGERISAMPIQKGETLLMPVITHIKANSVTVSINNEALVLPFSQY